MRFKELPYESGSWVVYVGEGYVLCPDCARRSEEKVERVLVSELERPDVCDSCSAVLLGPYIYGPDLVGGLARYKRWRDYHEVDYVRGVVVSNLLAVARGQESLMLRAGNVIWVVKGDPLATAYGYRTASQPLGGMEKVYVATPRWAKAGDWIGWHYKSPNGYWVPFVGRIAEVRDAEEGR